MVKPELKADGRYHIYGTPKRGKRNAVHMAQNPLEKRALVEHYQRGKASKEEGDFRLFLAGRAGF